MEELQNILILHKEWLATGGVGGKRADLRDANLQCADLRDANLQCADLRGADLRGANLDYSCWPLWCGTRDVKIDKRIFYQLAAHLCAVEVDDKECVDAQTMLMPIAMKSHRANMLLGES